MRRGRSGQAKKEPVGVETPVFEALVLGALLLIALAAIGVCLYVQGDRPEVSVVIRAARTAAGRPMVVEGLGTSERSTPEN